MPYFDSITNTSAFKAKYSLWSPINEFTEVRAASHWSAHELAGARLIIRTARPESHMLPALREYFDEDVHSQPQIREFLDGPSRVDDHTLTETEFVHRYGSALGPFWAALVKFGDVPVDSANDDDDVMSIEGDESNIQKRPHSSGSEDSASILPVIPTKRVRKETHHPGFVSSQSMKVASSSPTRSPEQRSQVSSAGHVGEEGTSTDIPEQATVQIVSSFIRHILRACPPQDDTRRHRPKYLVEFSGISRRLTGDIVNGKQVRATGDGELVFYELDNGSYKLTSYRPALLEAKKRFTAIEDGEPVMTDEVLGQMTGEALALRLQLEQEKVPDEE